MEEKINIAKILKDKSKGIRLYSPIFGECAFSFVREETDDICVKKHNGEKAFFNFKGLYNILGECLLFPSKEMRDWAKFSWKKGDVLANGEGDYCVFKEFAHSSYQTVKAVFVKRNKESIHSNSCLLDTKDWHKASYSCTATYINTIEKELSGKLNMETLEIENAQPEFKDGDILYVKTKLGSEYIMINKLSEEVKTACYVACNLSSKKIFWNRIHSVCRDEEIDILRQATDYEKSQLFEALAKENKAWDSEKKSIFYLKKPKWTPKPFDRVITRTPETPWTANFFSHIDSDGIKNCIDDRYIMCLPYNEETAKLIGTTNNWEG